MPNHTTTILELKGDQGEIERFKTENRGEEKALSFETGYPMPPEEEALQMLETITMSSSLPTWGTKWDCYEVGEWTEENTLDLPDGMVACNPLLPAHFGKVSKHFL